MIKKFRQEINKGLHTFSFRGKLYSVLDEYIIYNEASDTLYYKDIDF